ncbi:hypothetical protein SSPO_096180 [Streptomyces antimycoticus]|uniref:Uncharacterized protein n=1 Tax=Streptomyces antimycoticus TaxID=68175 RepID=A0A499V248_9ACTN|nr:hypothetical protein [Streptomyces antimycoticus]BBJ46900.1 hypothetical protein SSPO_096180 [Streptomyces antimycoticus]
MVSVTSTARNIEITAESLQEDLARLEIQKQALERELATVTAHLGAVQRALNALQALMPASAPSSAAPGPVDADSTPKLAPARQAPAGHTDAHADSVKTYGKLTEQILAYFAEAEDVDVRARDVASALGRDTDSGSINAVRSTLDRLVGTSRVRRAGRGLYRAVRP